MEEILASIRRIISEDDQPATASASDPAPPHGDDEADVLELTQKVEPTTGGDLAGVADEDEFVDETAQAGESIGDLDVFSAAPTPANQTASQPAPQAQAFAPSPIPAPAPSGTPMRDSPLVSEPAAQAAASRFGALEQTVQLERGVAMPSGQTMDQVIRDMLNPMLKAWLDENLEQIVDAKVQAEVERISRRR